MTLLLQILWTLLAAMTVENLLLPGTLGFSRMLRAARKPEHRAWYAIFVGIFSAISLELSLLIPPQLFPAYANVLRPLCLALCAAAAYLAASFALRRLLPGFLRRHGSVLAPDGIMENGTEKKVQGEKPFRLRLRPAPCGPARGASPGGGRQKGDLTCIRLKWIRTPIPW